MHALMQLVKILMAQQFAKKKGVVAEFQFMNTFWFYSFVSKNLYGKKNKQINQVMGIEKQTLFLCIVFSRLAM